MARRRGKRRHKGVIVNEEIRAPRPPGRWVDEARCHVCGEWYNQHRTSECDFQAGAQRVRWANPDGGGFRSRGPVLWAMRVCKLESWYLRHFPCGQWWDGTELEDDEDVIPPWELEGEDDGRLDLDQADEVLDAHGGDFDAAVDWVEDAVYGDGFDDEPIPF